jgi:hypothetical protein
MRTTPIAGEVGGRAGYTPTAGNPCSMDIPVPIGARPHIQQDHQSPQDQTSRGDRKPTINGSGELNGGRQVSSQVQPLGLSNCQQRAARVLAACHQGSQNGGGHLSTNSTAAMHRKTVDALAIIFKRENHLTAPPSQAVNFPGRSAALEGDDALSAVPTATLLFFCLWRMKIPILVKLV